MAARLIVATAVLAIGAGASGAAGFHEVDRLPTHRKLVALTFDGGGDTANGTASILKTLSRRRVPATFFLAGRWISLGGLLAVFLWGVLGTPTVNRANARPSLRSGDPFRSLS